MITGGIVFSKEKVIRILSDKLGADVENVEFVKKNLLQNKLITPEAYNKCLLNTLKGLNSAIQLKLNSHYVIEKIEPADLKECKQECAYMGSIFNEVDRKGQLEMIALLKKEHALHGNRGAIIKLLLPKFTYGSFASRGPSFPGGHTSEERKTYKDCADILYNMLSLPGFVTKELIVKIAQTRNCRVALCDCFLEKHGDDCEVLESVLNGKENVFHKIFSTHLAFSVSKFGLTKSMAKISGRYRELRKQNRGGNLRFLEKGRDQQENSQEGGLSGDVELQQVNENRQEVSEENIKFGDL